MDRRTFLKLGAGSLMGSFLLRYAHLARAQGGPSLRSGRSPATGPATACIVLWLNGGPSHLDTFDPKPGTKEGGPFKAIKTRAPGVLISEHLPHLAEVADKLAIVRGMASKEGSHARAQYLAHTSYSPNPTVIHPSFGAWASDLLPSGAADLPSFVAVGGPSAGAGFLGAAYDPFILQKAGGMPQNVEPPPNVDDARFARRRDALAMLEERFAKQTGDAKVAGRRAVYGKADRLMHSPKAKLFDLSNEPAAMAKSYGDTDFGRGCLLARRLVESGVRFVEVALDGWDTHKDNFTRTKSLMGALDPAFAALVTDLDQRKLLSSTLVVCMGEFGRTPKINGNDGRDHHPQAWSAVLAGGGARGGIAYGATDATGDKVVSNALGVADLLATMASLLGMDPNHSETSPAGRPIAVTDQGVAVRALMAP